MTLPAEEPQLPPESEVEQEGEQAVAPRQAEPESEIGAPEREPTIAARDSEVEPQRDGEREPRQEQVHARAADMADYHSRFAAVQSEFFDEPRQAVEKAASLVEEAVDAMMHALQRELEQVRSELGEGTDTERLRIALRHYRDVLESLDIGGPRPIR